MYKINLLLCAVMLLTACGNNTTTTTTTEPTPVETVEEAKVVPTGETVEVSLQGDDNMKYDKNEIRVKEGQMVRLTLTHTGKMEKTAMGHNFVLISNEISLNEFGDIAAKASAPDYEIPADIQEYVIAKTKMLGGGESETIEFLTPKKGTYDFLCSFPGHYAMMKGSFIVE